MSSDELRAVVNEILKLNPKPGDSSENNTKQMQVIPDFQRSATTTACWYLR